MKRSRHLLSLSIPTTAGSVAYYGIGSSFPRQNAAVRTVFLVSFRDKQVVFEARLFTWPFLCLPAVDRLLHADSSRVLKCYQLSHLHEAICDDDSDDWSKYSCHPIGCSQCQQEANRFWILFRLEGTLPVSIFLKDYFWIWWKSY